MTIAYGLLKPKGKDGWSGPKAYRHGSNNLVEGLFVRGREQEWRRMPAIGPNAGKVFMVPFNGEVAS